MEDQAFGSNKLEFRQLVLQHIKRILDISCHELRDNTYVVSYSNHAETKHLEDTRISYIQSIENLAFVLLPHFDKTMKEFYEKGIKVLGSTSKELTTNFPKKYKTFIDIYGEGYSKEFSTWFKMKIAKQMFAELNLLLHRNDYLKSAIYEEEKE